MTAGYSKKARIRRFANVNRSVKEFSKLTLEYTYTYILRFRVCRTCFFRIFIVGTYKGPQSAGCLSLKFENAIVAGIPTRGNTDFRLFKIIIGYI